MRHHPSIVASLLLVTVCGPEGETTMVQDAAAPAAGQPTATANVAKGASVPEAEPTPTIEAEAEPEPLPNAEPAELRLALYGRCGDLGVSTLGAEVFVHYDGAGIDHLDRMDERGGVAQTFGFSEPLDVGYDTLYRSSIRGLYGRWPDQAYLLVDYDAREFSYRPLYRLADDDWKRVKLLPVTADYEQLWPWYDRSILALTTDDEKNAWPRLVVVRGKPKGPSLEAVRRRAKCGEWEIALRDLHPRDDGGLTALVQCGGAWLSTWAPGERKASVKKLGSASNRAQLLLGDDGEGFIALDSGILEWRKGTAQPVALPEGGALDEVDRGPDGEPWIRQGTVISKWTSDGWQRVMELPEGPRVRGLYGLEVRTPWLRREDESLSMQTADGSWHGMPLSPTPDLDKVPKPEVVHVVGPGDVWVTSRYWKLAKGKKHVGKEMRALYTTRPVETPRECG